MIHNKKKSGLEDIDLLLMEELCVNPDFAKFFLKNISSADFDIADEFIKALKNEL